jgi:hypothetical protein
MPGRRYLQGLTLSSCTLGALLWASPLVAVQAGTGKTEPKTPKITDVKFLEFLAPEQEALYRRSKGKLHSVFQKVRFRLAVLGENLACNPNTKVFLEPKDPAQPVEEVKQYCQDSRKEIDISGVARVGTVITAVKVTDACDATTLQDNPRNDQGYAAGGQGTAVDDQVKSSTGEDKVLASLQCPSDGGANANKDDPAASKCTAVSQGLTISIKAIPPESALQEFEVAFEHHQSKEFPNLHSLTVTKQSGDVGVGFDVKQSHMRIDLEPTGATDLTALQSNEENLVLNFVAAPDYEPTNIVITVYNGSDLDVRKARFVARAAAAAKPPAKDPNEPTITSVETVFVDRHAGNGRIRIYGKGFGKPAKAAPFPVDDFLCDCLERPQLDFLTEPRPRPCGHFAESFFGTNKPEKVTALDKPEKVTALEAPGKMALLEHQAAERKEYCEKRLPIWNKWHCGVSAIANVESREINIRVEKAEIIDMNDEMVDVYFEFTRHHGYAWPFRLAGVDLTIQKPVKKVEQVVKSEQAKISGEVDSSSPATYNASSPIGPKLDENLTYRFTVMAYDEARRLLGDGVADNFYAIELSVVNDGPKKVAVPLAGIQAGIEWLYGPVSKREPASVKDLLPSNNKKSGFFLEGPPTLAPIPMATVSAYFGASKKNGERRVRVFNILEGVTTLLTSLVPFAGSGLKDAEVVFSGGFIPGLRHAWGDITDQQLQNLTTLSWQTSETLAANGGSLEKIIYIQKGAQFQDEDEPIWPSPYSTKQQISNILSLEVVGYEVNDSPPKKATPAGKKPAADKPTKTPPATTTPSAGSTPGAPPKAGSD